MYKCQINVYLVLIQNNQLLMMKRANTGFQDGMYSVPAGKLKHTNVLHRYSSEGTVAMDFFIHLHEFSGNLCNMEPEKCDEIAWVSLDAIPKNTIPYVKKGILNSIRGIILDEHIWE